MDERVFLDEGGMRVTNARFITPAQTYAMSGVTSVKREIKPASRGAGLILAVVGLCMMMGSSGSPGLLAVGLILLCGGVYLAYAAKATHFVVIHSASGESRATHSKDEGFIDRVIGALNDSIIARG